MIGLRFIQDTTDLPYPEAPHEAAPARRHDPRRRFQPTVEGVERRRLLALFLVTSNGDLDDNGDPVPGSLRQAIIDSNALVDPSGPNLIQFSLPDDSPIQPTAALPAITNPVTIDGRVAQAGGPAVTIDGSNATPDGGPAADGLDIQAGQTVVEGLAIVNFAGSGISLSGPGGDLVADDYIGVGTDGQTVEGNGVDGVTITSPNNTIGAANVLSGGVVQILNANIITNNGTPNGPGDGIRIDGAQASGNSILGNYLGVNLSNNNGLGQGNANDGVQILDAADNTIGGATAADRNVISYNGVGGSNPNAEDGVEIDGSDAPGNVVEGNYIGLDLMGSSNPQGNVGDGIQIISAPRSLVRDNDISGNSSGVVIQRPTATGNIVSGNMIGLDAAGSATVPNLYEGVEIIGAPGNTIGGQTAADRNVISGNGDTGIDLEFDKKTNTAASGNSILGNYIGTDELGDDMDGFGNVIAGIYIDGVPNNVVGGPDAGNVISDNGGDGVDIVNAGATGNSVLGNLIGIAANGEDRLGNTLKGIRITDASGNTVGGTSDGDRNVISGNDGEGITIDTSGATGATASGNVILGNYIGLDAHGNTRVENANDGIEVGAASSNTIGGSNAGDANVISGNDGYGINIQSLEGVNSDDNLVSGNVIGLDVGGLLNLGNLSSGVRILNGSGNTIGGTVAGARNVIAYNLFQGISIVGTTIFDPANPNVAIGNRSAGNLIEGNYIGADPTGAVNDPNGADGVEIDASIDNTIGGTTASARNVIYDNYGNGVNLTFGANDNAVQGNYIGIGADGETGIGNHAAGVSIYSSTGNTIGGTTGVAGNVISNNQASGVVITQGSSGNLLEGNDIGLDIGGQVAVPNGFDGVTVEIGSDNNTIGGLAGAATRNVISGNTANGVALVPSAGAAVTGTAILGNYIGTNAQGTSAVGTAGKPLGNLGDGVLVNDSSGDSIAGNLISGNSLAGVNVTGGAGSTDNQVFANLIGTDATGSRATDAAGQLLGNRVGGVSISDSPGNTIGGSTLGLGNVISGNVGVGVEISGAGASGNLVQGNAIGTDVLGSIALGNALAGVLIFDAESNVIGGLEPGARNIISGNRAAGVEILSSSNLAGGNAVVGDLIGTDLTGTRIMGADGVLLGNTGAGVLLQQVSGELVGLDEILGNSGSGVNIEGGKQNTLISNLIGIDAAGGSSLGNFGDGVLVDGSAGDTIGGITPFSRDIISGNLGDGVALLGPSTVGNIVFGDSIGVDGSGEGAAGNLLDGVRLSDAGSGNDVSGDIISGNAGAGIEVTGSSSGGPVIQGDFVGTDATGEVALANSVGIYVHDNPSPISIGGTSAETRDVVSGNTEGIVIGQVSPETGGVTVQGSYIGPDARGTAIPSHSAQESGIFIDAATDVVVGGPAPGAGNLISGNGTAGVYILGQAGTNGLSNYVLGNVIGGFSGVSPSDASVAGEQGVGVLINSSAGNVVGGNAAGYGNYIVDNGSGVEIVGIPALGSPFPDDTIQGNVLDFNSIGAFLNDAVDNLIGGPLAADGNDISHNSLQGITIFGPGSTGNVVLSDQVDANTLAGVFLDGSIGNSIGGAVGNEISGNGAPGSSDGVGVYLLDGAQGNAVQRNQITDNTAYGVFLYNSAGNVDGVIRVGPAQNDFGGNIIADFREYTGPAPSTATTGGSTSKAQS